MINAKTITVVGYDENSKAYILLNKEIHHKISKDDKFIGNK